MSVRLINVPYIRSVFVSPITLGLNVGPNNRCVGYGEQLTQKVSPKSKQMISKHPIGMYNDFVWQILCPRQQETTEIHVCTPPLHSPTQTSLPPLLYLAGESRQHNQEPLIPCSHFLSPVPSGRNKNVESTHRQIQGWLLPRCYKTLQHSSRIPKVYSQSSNPVLCRFSHFNCMLCSCTIVFCSLLSPLHQLMLSRMVLIGLDSFSAHLAIIINEY